MKKSSLGCLVKPIVAVPTILLLVVCMGMTLVRTFKGFEAARFTANGSSETGSVAAVIEFTVNVDTNATLVDLANSFNPYDKPSKEGWRGVGDALVRYELEHGKVQGDSTNQMVAIRLCTHTEIGSVLATHRPSTMRELLALGFAYRQDLAKFEGQEIMALGTRKFLESPEDEVQTSPCLTFYKGGKGLLTFGYQRDWPKETLFAMTRK